MVKLIALRLCQLVCMIKLTRINDLMFFAFVDHTLVGGRCGAPHPKYAPTAILEKFIGAIQPSDCLALARLVLQGSINL